MNGITGIGRQESELRRTQEAEFSKAQDIREAKKEEEKAQESREDFTKKNTVNTDKVDREIERLKKRRKELEQQLSGAEEGSGEWERLKKELTQTEAELKRKDNDAYRKSHSQRA